MRHEIAHLLTSHTIRRRHHYDLKMKLMEMKINYQHDKQDPSSSKERKKAEKGKSCYKPIKVLNFSFTD